MLGTTYSIPSLFDGLLLSSGNDAAHALANAAGGFGPTVALMNETPANCRRTTPSPRIRATRRRRSGDVGVRPRADRPRRACSRGLRSYVAKQRLYFGGVDGSNGFEIQNHNKLLANYPGAIGVKTGYTSVSLH